MILAEKIIKLRKEQGWSQEELASRLNISRQSVSKWESMASVPELDKIIMLSELFGVSTDYLLKDDADDENVNVADLDNVPDNTRKISLNEANAFLSLVHKCSSQIAMAVSICILSPVVLLFLGGVQEYGKINISENAAGAIGVSVLLIMVTVAVAIFIVNGLQLNEYEYLEKEPISLDYGVAGIVETKKEQYKNKFTAGIVTGVALCIVSIIPIIFASMFENEFMEVCGVCLLFLLAAIGVYFIVNVCIVWGGFQRLLEEGDYTKTEKERNRENEPLTVFYWCIITAIYLGISFYTQSWDRTWIVWPVAAVLFAALLALKNLLKKDK